MAAPIPGIEGLHTWSLGSSESFTLNDKDTLPRWKVTKITGLRSKPEQDDNKQGTPGRMGEIPYPELLRGKTVVYEGTLECKTLDELRRQESQALAFFAPESIGQMSLTFDPSYPYGAGFAYYYEAKVRAFDIPDVQSRAPFALPTAHARDFTLGLRLYDPRIYQTPGVGPFATGSAADTGGITPPFTPPILLAGSVVGGQVTVTNNGNAQTDPVIDLYGPATSPSIENITIGKILQLQNLELTTVDDFVRIDFKSRQVTLGGTLRADLTDPSISTWWDGGVPGLVPGDNTLQYRAAGVGVPEMSPSARAEVSFYHANF